MQNLNACGLVDDPGVAAHDAAINGVSGRLTVQLVTDAGAAAVTVVGELDLETTPEFDRRLAGIDVTQITRLLIDLGGVTFMDSTGLSSIVRAHQRAESHGHTLVLRRGSRQVQRLFEVTGIDERLTFEDDERSI
jgi:anti-sigma B factor antagonist